ncbi:hypothetical protein LNQ81_07910 [Myroides sp. M-43]|uniref:hypothetical protein n=1 Tax=Myroides oncorhynchi TaxID=2893756 RepID=UPI001E60A67F|nr:hypothetical protein [Myroides oncorhynchi]MCC9042612.1 hypothetical protein [Myroides oncorhynchi]
MRKVLSITGTLLVIGVIVFLGVKYWNEGNAEYPFNIKIVEDSNRIRSFVEDTDDGFDIYYLIRQDNGEDLRIDNVYYYDVAAPDYASENFIRFSDQKSELIGLYNDRGMVVIPPIYSAMTRVHNGMLYALEGGVKDNIGANGDRHDVLLGGTTFLLNTKGDILIEDMIIPNNNLDMYSLTITDEPILDSYYMAFKGINGKCYNFVDLVKYFELFVKEEFLPSTLNDNWKDYLSDNVKVNIEVKNENVGDYIVYDKHEMLTTQKDLVTKAFELANSNDSTGYKLVYDVDDWIVTVDTELMEDKDKNSYLNKEGVWKGKEFPVFQLNIKEVEGTQTRSNHYDFYRNRNGGMTLYEITIRANYY